MTPVDCPAGPISTVDARRNTLASGLQTDGRYPWSLFGVHTEEETGMAEIRVEPRRRSMVWVWILLLLIIAGGLAYYFLYYRNGQL